MKSQRHVNTFYKGMVQDVDKLQMQAETYFYALNGRVVYNIDGTYAFENANGTLLALTITPNYGIATAGTYVPVGGVQLNGYLILFLSNATTGNSEIGLITQPTFGTFAYQTAFNDLYDPNQQKLNFSVSWPMRDFEVVAENSLTQNVYFNDNHNEPRVFNIQLGTVPYTSGGTTWFAAGQQYQPQPLPITAASRYPAFYSVHAMAQMIDLTWGLPHFVQTIGGELLTGSYQYSYRYISQNGYASPWSPITAQFFVNLDTPGGDWTAYQMLNSNQQSTKGNLIQIDYLDTRFQQIEVAAIYWETDAAPTSAYTFWQGNIPSNGSLQIEHQFAGQAIDLSTLTQTYLEISKAKTGGLKDNQRNLVNYSVFPLLEIDTTGITVTPLARPMLSDNTLNVSSIPLTNQPVTANDTVMVSVAQGVPLKLDIKNDYISYKGVQFAGSFRGNFRGEIYPYAIVLFDRKGQPFFAQHISDFTMPKRFGNVCSDNRLSGQVFNTFGVPGQWNHTAQNNGTNVTDNQTTDNYFLNLLGVMFGGIDLTPILFDASGNLQVSGFSIVRTARIAQIMGQGLILSSGDTVDNNRPGHSGQNLALPLPTAFNGYLCNVNPPNGILFLQGQPYAGNTGGTSPNYQGFLPLLNPLSNPNTTFVGLNPIPHNISVSPPAYVPGTLGSIPNFTANARIGFFECPDYMINNGITLADQPIEGDCLELATVCTTAYTTNQPLPLGSGTPAENTIITSSTVLTAPGQTQPMILNYPGAPAGYPIFYQKNYRTVLTSNPATGYNVGGTVLTPNQVGNGIGNPEPGNMFQGQTNLGDRFNFPQTPQSWWVNIQPAAETNNQVFYNPDALVVDYLGWGRYMFSAYTRQPSIMFEFPTGTATGAPNTPVWSNPPSGNANTYTASMFGVMSDNGFGHSAYFIANYIRPIGGYQITEQLLQNRTYLPIGHIVPVNMEILNTIKTVVGGVTKYIFNNVEVWGGDCFLDYYTYYRLYSDFTEVNGNHTDYNMGLSFPVESVYNTALRQGNTYDNLGPMPSGQLNAPQNAGFPNGLFYQDNTTYKLEDFNENVVLDAWTTQTFACSSKPATFMPIYDFPVNEICTGVKVYGELFDTFRLFPIDNIQSADGSKGQINSMQYIFDNLYIIQERAVARVRFNDRNQSTGSLGSSVVLATEVGYGGHDYINYEYGTTNQFSVVNTGKALHFIDTEQGKHLRFAQDGLLSPSDLYGMHNFFYSTSRQYFNQDNPVGAEGILGVYDFKNQSVYYTFSKIFKSPTVTIPAATLEFSDGESQYKGFHSFTPDIYFNYSGYMLSPNPSSATNLYIHDAGNKGLIYGQYFNTRLNFTVNPIQTEPCWFDNGRIALNTSAASTKMNTGTFFVQDMPIQQIVFPVNTKWRYRQGFLEYGMRGAIGTNTPMRLRGKWCTVGFDIINDASNTVVRISNHATKERISPRA